MVRVVDLGVRLSTAVNSVLREMISMMAMAEEWGLSMVVLIGFDFGASNK